MNNPKLNCRLYPEIGWLAPDGKYYTPLDERSGWLHYDIAVELVKAFHPEIDPDDLMVFGQMSYGGVMAGLGYIRVDIKRTMFDGWDFDNYKPTEKQMDTLFNLSQMKGWVDDGAPEGIRQFLVEYGDGQFEFLRKGGE